MGPIKLDTTMIRLLQSAMLQHDRVNEGSIRVKAIGL